MNNLEYLINEIREGNYIIEKFTSGLKNNVGKAIINDSITGIVIKEFSYENHSKIDLFENELLGYKRLENYYKKPELLFFDSCKRIIAYNFIEGKDLSKHKLISYELDELSEFFFKMINFFKKTNYSNLREVNIEQNLYDGLKILKKEKYITNFDNLNIIAKNLCKQMKFNKTKSFLHGSLNSTNIIYGKEFKIIDLELCAQGPLLYDFAFFIGRNELSFNQNNEIINELSDKINFKKEDFIQEIDIYKLANTVLLLGLDAETINSGNNSEIFKNRFVFLKEKLNENYSNNKELLNFVELFNSSVIV